MKLGRKGLDQVLVLVFILLSLSVHAKGIENVKSSSRLQPGDLTYLGAFRVPDGIPGSEVRTWAWGGFAISSRRVRNFENLSR